MKILNWIAFILVIIGSVTWGLVGIFNWNLVSAITGGAYNTLSAIIYILVFLSALWLIFAAVAGRGRIYLCDEDRSSRM